MIVEIDIGIIHNFSSCNTFPVEIYHVILVRAGWECLQIIEANIPESQPRLKSPGARLAPSPSNMSNMVSLMCTTLQYGPGILLNIGVMRLHSLKISQTLPQFIKQTIGIFVGKKLAVI